MMVHLAHGLIELGVHLDLLLIRKDSPYVVKLPEKRDSLTSNIDMQ